MLAGYASGGIEGGLETTVSSLHDMGFDKRTGLFLPDMQEHACKVNLWHPKRVHYTLMPDLREGGKYELRDAEEFDFALLADGGGLKELYEKSCKEILQAHTSGSYSIICMGHGSGENPELAVRRMFLVQFNGGTGRLCVADLNHLVIRKVK